MHGQGTRAGRLIARGHSGPSRLALALFIAMLASAPVNACQIPGALVALARGLSALPKGSDAIPEWQAARLADQLSDMSERRILREMEKAGL